MLKPGQDLEELISGAAKPNDPPGADPGAGGDATPPIEKESDKILSQISGLDDEDRPAAAPAKPAPKEKEDVSLVKKLRSDLETANKRLRELETARETPPPANPPPVVPRETPRETPPPVTERTPEAVREENGKTFRILEKASRAIAGEVVDGIESVEQAKSLQKIASEIVGMMTPEELAVVLQEAQAGKYGESSQAIADLVRRESSPALMREHLAEKERTAQRESQEKINETIQKQLDGVYDRYPALKQREAGKESAEYKYSIKWFAENVGTAEKPGLYYGLGAKSPELIGKIFDRMMADYEFEALKGVKADRDRLNETLSRIRNPESGSRPVGESAPARESDALRQQIIEKAGITET